MTRAAVAAAIVLLALAGCSATGGDAVPDGGDSSVAAEPESGTGSADDGATEASDDSDDAAGADDAAAVSGAAPTLVSEAPEGSPTIAIGASAMEPSSLTIPAGTVVVFTSGDGSYHGLLVGDLASVTVAESLPEYYLFTEPGRYSVADELTAGTATITVQ